MTIVLCGTCLVALSAMAGCDRDDDVRDAFSPSMPRGAGSEQRAHDHQGRPSLPPGHPLHGGAASDHPQQQMPATDPARSAPPDDPEVAAFLGLKAPKPAEWAWQPPSNPMVHTNYAAPGVEGSDEATITVFFFGAGMGGPIQDNVDRWQRQFLAEDGSPPEPVVTAFEADGMEITFVELEGAYQAMGDPTFTPNQLFLAAIVEAPVGRVFIRFVGPQETVEHHRDAFMTMIRNMRNVEASGEVADDPGAPYSG